MHKQFKRVYILILLITVSINLLFSNTLFAQTIKAQNIAEDTSIGGIISSDTTLTLENSPYRINQDIQIAYGVTLKIEPGVVIYGDNHYIKVWGTLNAIGNSEKNITLENVNVSLCGKSTEPAFFEIAFANINGGSIVNPNVNVMYGSFNLRDSNVKDLSGIMYVWYPISDVNIERNVFTNSGGISVGTSGSAKVNIINNVFYKQTTDYAIENWASYGNTQTVVQYNSFLSNDKVALRLPSGYDNANIIATNNYWGTEDKSIIDNMIFDKRDNLGAAAVIETLPILIEPDINTPKVNYSDFIVALIEPRNGYQYLNITDSIAVKFNKDIFIGSRYDEIVVKDISGNVVETSKRVDKNNLILTPVLPYNFNTNYTLNIPKDSLQDSNGNSLATDSIISFKTRDNIAGSLIGGLILSDMTLSINNSPYTLTEDVEIDYGVTLNVEPGVVINGNNYSIKTWGKLNAIGAIDKKININNTNIVLNGKYYKNAFIDIQYANINGGTFISPNGYGIYGAFNLRDSIIKDLGSFMYVWYPTSDVNIERNIFTNSGGISCGLNNGVKVNIINNVFYKQTTDYAVENWASYGSSQVIVQYNSFLSNDRVALRLPSGYNNAKMIATNNYWGTDDTLIIDNMIFDKKDNLGSAAVIETLPILLEPDKNTPVIDITNLEVSLMDPSNSQSGVSIYKDIVVKFNKNIQQSSEYDNISVLDSNGNKISTIKEIKDNTLTIKNEGTWAYNNYYYINIPMKALEDANGNTLSTDYKTFFKTKDENTFTSIGGIIEKDTILTLENSPYILDKDMQITYGAILSIEPGVIIKGNNYNIKVWGTFSALGTNDKKIKFESTNISGYGNVYEKSFIDIQYAEIIGGTFMSPNGNAVYGSFNLRDSIIDNLASFMYVCMVSNF